jgi:CelD/BcsL family acetyltransferase involved in cellulose biosynthesis
MEYQLVAEGRVHGLRSDFDSAYEEMSPGAHLNRCLVEALFGRGLVRYYLGPGGNAYKQRWTDQVEAREELTIFGRSMTGWSLAAWEIAVKPWARAVRDRFRRPPRETSEPTEP